MFALFKRREWVPETLAELKGSFAGLHVRMANVPCLREKEGTRCKFPYSDFGFEFLNRLHEQLGASDSLATRLNMGIPAKALIKLRSYPAMTVEIRGKASLDIGQFQSDIADALLAAFDSVELRSS
jgi:hypothetical protein